MAKNHGVYQWLRRGLFRLDAERAHQWVMGGFRRAMAPAPIRGEVARRLAVESPRLEVTVLGLNFPNPIGMAAGFDKNGRYFNGLGALGFGHIEIGTVTGQEQAGNRRPRLFRLVNDQGLLNRMGFNNEGSKAVARRLEQKKIEPILGINIGKSKAVSLDDAGDDYELSMRRLHRFADYLVVNVSSPNTPGLRRLQGAARLGRLLERLGTLNDRLSDASPHRRPPLVLKVSPDLSDSALTELLAVIAEAPVDGIIATNTTVSRKGLRTPDVTTLGAGGVSGRPLTARSRQMVATIYEQTEGKLPIIGVGGVFDGADMLAMIEAGASLVQIWTGFVYEGPLVGRQILRDLLRLMDARGYASISDACGAAHDRSSPALRIT